MDTKRIEQIRKEASDERQTLRGGGGLSSHFAALCLELLEYVSCLEDWKAPASKAVDRMQLQVIGREIGVQLWRDIGPAILPWILNQKAQASKVPMAPHVFAQMVNRVRDLAFDFGTTEQFRDRVSELLGEYVNDMVPEQMTTEESGPVPDYTGEGSAWVPPATPKPKTPEACETCKYGKDPFTSVIGPSVKCLRRAPVITTDSVFPVFPTMPQSGWCGDYAP